MWRRGRTVLRRKVLRRGPVQNRLAAGGALVAIVGGDGAGKSTVVDGLVRWLRSENIETHAVHLGKPPWSPLTLAVKGVMRIVAAMLRAPTPSGRSLRSALSDATPTRITMRHRARVAWEVLTARDRYRAYRRARRLATNGAIVVSDRYPLPEVSSMDGAVMGRASDLARWGRWGRAMARLERRYYDRIADPDVLVVLTVEPDTAVERKRGIEPEATVRPRSEEIRGIDWTSRAAAVIDTSAPEDEVLTRAKLAVWSRL
jgi:thymidylate kinase